MNISEFAKLAGVSKSAVSRYFNNGYLSSEKTALIKAAIEKTGYAPSLSARSVKNKITKLVGVIIPKLSSESIARITEGISATRRSTRWSFSETTGWTALSLWQAFSPSCTRRCWTRYVCRW